MKQLLKRRPPGAALPLCRNVLSFGHKNIIRTEVIILPNEFAVLNVVCPILLGIHFILLIIAGISRKEALFLATLIFGALCVAYIRIFIPLGGYMLSGIYREVFSLFMPWLFRAVNIVTFLVCAIVKSKAGFRLPWRKVLLTFFCAGLALDLLFCFLPQLL